MAALASIARTERLPGLYRGLGPTILSNAPFSALYYMFYNSLRAQLSGVSPDLGIFCLAMRHGDYSPQSCLLVVDSAFEHLVDGVLCI